MFNLGNFGAGAGFAAIGAAVMAAWGYIRTVMSYATGLVFGKVVYKEQAGNAVMSYAFGKAIRSPLGMRLFGGWNAYVHPKRWREYVAYEAISKDPFLVRHDGHFALIGLLDNGDKGNPGIGNWDTSNTVTVRYVRRFFNPEKFLDDAVEHYNKQQRQLNGTDKRGNGLKRFRVVRVQSDRGGEERSPAVVNGESGLDRQTDSKDEGAIEMKVMNGVYKLLKWNKEDLRYQPEEGQSPFTGYPFPSTVANAISELKCWLAHEKWFRSKSIPWRRGWLLHGQPGTGKSTLVRALGMSFDLPVFMFDLAGMTNEFFAKSWDGVLNNTPAIALIEDIDAVFKGREYIGGQVVGRDHLTFDCVLNCISGVKQSDGVFLIVTTNHVETLDPALGVPDANGRSSRPGRIDRAIYLGVMETQERQALARHILSDNLDLVEQTVKDGEGETAAQFQARCAALALSKFWQKV